MSKQAILHRMVTDQHICRFGLRSKDLLERQGYAVEDHKLSSRTETDKFKEQHKVKTTPQTFIDDQRIGGYDDLREFFGMDKAGQNGTTYTPVIAIFSIAALMTLAIQFSAQATFISTRTLLLFIATSMVLLALQKLKDLLEGCIGCGCLSMKNCPLYNPDDLLAKQGPGPVLLNNQDTE